MTKTSRQSVAFSSLGAELKGILFTPESGGPFPTMIVCHGAGEYKENYFDLCEVLARHGIAGLAFDLHGHGESGGTRHHVKMSEWVPDIQAAIEFLAKHPATQGKPVGAFGLSSGGTAILEAAVVDSRIKCLVPLDATVRNSLPFALSATLKTFIAVGHVKKLFTGKDLKVPLAKMGKAQMVSDPDIEKKLMADPKTVEAYMAFPFPGAGESFFVDTIERVSAITAPTRIIWGEEDQLDSTETAHLLHAKLTCEKDLQIIPGNGHAGHLDRHRDKVFALTADWAVKHLAKPPNSPAPAAAASAMARQEGTQIIEGAAARALGQKEKWEMLSPFLKQHGRHALSYSTLQGGMEYFINDLGYISYNTIQHPVFARQPKKIAFADPVCAPADLPKMIGAFLAKNPRAVFSCVSEECASVLRSMGYKANSLGPEVELPIQSYNTKGNWKELDLIKRARNEAKREGIVIREEAIEKVNKSELAALSGKWIGSKKVNDREIWIYARRAVFEVEADVRKFFAFDRDGRVAGFVFYDPMYRAGTVIGYSATVVRCDESRFGKLVTAMHMEAMEKFKTEGKELLNLHLSPFVKLEEGRFNDDFGCKMFFKLSARYGNDIYNFQGLAFHKSKYRGSEHHLYFVSKSLWPSNDVYLAFLSADIARNYFETMGLLLRGMLKGKPKNNRD